MATIDEFHQATRGLGLEDDCPLCGCSWPMCHGLCVAHEAMNGMPGPFHFDYNDDCEQCSVVILPSAYPLYDTDGKLVGYHTPHGLQERTVS